MLPYFMAGIESTGHDALKKCFTLEAVKKASKVVWDEEQRCVISQEDNLLNMLFDCDIDDEYDDAGDDTEPLIIDIENLEPGMAAKQGPYSVRVNSDVVSGFCTHVQTYGLTHAPLVT